MRPESRSMSTAIRLRAADVAQELAEAGADVEHHVVGLDVALEEVRAEHAPDRVLRVAIGLGKARSVERDRGSSGLSSQLLHERRIS